ncbi:MAG: hypothetical protein COT09_02755 [Candidatus Hydromicrobium americanum]|nr:MAG: hypothetical protein COT09_02755 [Candidatus Hydromicrobium americanum]
MTENRVVVFVCNWCYPMAQDIKSINLTNSKNPINLIRVMCSGRITPAFIIEAFVQGADGVIGIGCPEGACHYVNGNETAEKNFLKAKDILYILGIKPNRIKFERLSSNESEKLEKIIGAFVKNIGTRNL